ncbi:MAG: NADP-dependent 3-hydroxy acid dehydrogenase YdfG [Actinomycetota bacterium]
MDYQGKTALITGASSGIGLAYAEEFARRGSNLVLVARRADLLDQIATKISAFAKVKVTVIAMDLATFEAGQQLADKVAELKIDVDFLVNNAGFGTNARLVDEDREVIQKEMVLNMLTLVDLTAIFIKPMVKRGCDCEHRQHGLLPTGAGHGRLRRNQVIRALVYNRRLG